jgi:excisionase family DNA binding protein
MQATISRPAEEASKPLRVKEIAAFFDVHRSTIYRAIEAGDLRAERVGGKIRGAIRVMPEAFEEYRATRALGGAAA